MQGWLHFRFFTQIQFQTFFFRGIYLGRFLKRSHTHTHTHTFCIISLYLSPSLIMGPPHFKYKDRGVPCFSIFTNSTFSKIMQIKQLLSFLETLSPFWSHHSPILTTWLIIFSFSNHLTTTNRSLAKQMMRFDKEQINPVFFILRHWNYSE